MTLFDLLFIVSLLGTVATLLVATVQLFRGHRAAAARIVAWLGIAVAAYLALVIGVSLVSPRLELPPGARRCWDDWCLAVEFATRGDSLAPGVVAAPDESLIMVAVRVSSAARGRAQRETGVHLFLLDASGARHDADRAAERLLVAGSGPRLTSDSLGTVLQPGSSFVHYAVFRVPRTATLLGLGKDGEGPGAFIIGDESSLLHRRTVTRLAFPETR